jgi:hypothetical protein
VPQWHLLRRRTIAAAATTTAPTVAATANASPMQELDISGPWSPGTRVIRRAGPSGPAFSTRHQLPGIELEEASTALLSSFRIPGRYLTRARGGLQPLDVRAGGPSTPRRPFGDRARFRRGPQGHRICTTPTSLTRVGIRRWREGSLRASVVLLARRLTLELTSLSELVEGCRGTVAQTGGTEERK